MKFIIILFALLPLQLFSGTWVKTHDNWNEDVIAINCPDSNHCFTLVDEGGLALLYRSTDQGRTWDTVYSTKDLLYAVSGSCPNPGYYYMSMYETEFLKISSDSGKTFKRVDLGTNQEINEVKMLDTNFGIAISMGTKGFYYILTYDGWKTFEKYEYMLQDTSLVGNLYSPSIHNKNLVSMIFGAKDYAAFINLDLKTKNWSIVNKFEDDEFGYFHPYDLQFVNDSLVFIVGRFKADTSEGNSALDDIYRSRDNGKTWEELLHQMGTGHSGLQKIAFKDELQGIAVGQWGSIVRTTDGGDTWTYDSVPKELVKGMPPTMTVGWAGSVPLVGDFMGRFWRYDEDLDIAEPIIDRNIRIRQNSTQLLISVEDPAFGKYEVMIADIMGDVVKRQDLSSGTGILYMPVNIEELNNGTYLYIITKNGDAVKTGKFVIVR